MGQDGIDLLRELRAFSNKTPTVFITAYRDTKHLQRAFDAGAHDYIKKPFELEELHARILSIKRVFNIENNKFIILDDETLFYPVQKTVHANNKKISLTAKDTLLLSYFLKNRSRLITNEELVQNIWNFDSLPSDATLRSHIRTLREIIGKEKIKTVRGEGYIFE